jgi:hypothetical protein
METFNSETLFVMQGSHEMAPPKFLWKKMGGTIEDMPEQDRIRRSLDNQAHHRWGEPLDASVVGVPESHIDLLVLYAALTERLNKQLEETC